MSIILEELKRLERNALKGVCSGIYLLFNNDELVYVGQSWNCFLGVAEQTRRDKIFTSWNFTHIEGETQRRDLKRQLIEKYRPKYNG